MRRLTSFLLIALVATAAGGDIKFIFVKHYQDPNVSGRTDLLSPEVFRNIEEELVWSGNGRDPLDKANCDWLGNIYSVLADPNDALGILARRIAAMERDTLYVYLIDDRDGLTQTMMDYVGTCDFAVQAVQGAEGKRYAWLCGHRFPERAVKIGQAYATAFVSAMECRGAASGGFQEALGGMVLAEMVSTTVTMQWQPNDLLFNPEKITTRSMGASPTTLVAGLSNAFGMHNTLTLMPTEVEARVRSLGVLLACCSNAVMREVYEGFHTERPVDEDTYFVARKGTETQRNLGPGNVKIEGTTDYEAYAWSQMTLPKLMDNEVFAGLTLCYFAASQPVIGSGADAKGGLLQTLDHFKEQREAGFTLLSVVHALMDNYATSVSRDETKIRKRLLLFIALIDMLSSYSTERDIFQALLETTLIPSGEIKGILDSYLGPAGGGSSRQMTIRMALAAKKSMREKVAHLCREFEQPIVGYF